jgi:hypothetical protein
VTFQAGRAPGEWVPAQAAWYEPALQQPWSVPVHGAGGHSERRFQALSAALFGAILLLSAAIGVVVSWPSASAPTESAAALRTQAISASENAGWVHVTALNTTGDVGPGEGSQVIQSSDQGNADVVFVGGVAYLRADATFLVSGLQLPSAVAADGANRWLSFQPTDPDFLQISAGLTTRSLITEAIPSGEVRLAGETTMDGQRVIGLTGLQDVLGTVSASQTAWVAAAAPHRIVASVAHAHNSGISVSTTLTFSRWGERVTVGAPDGAVPFVSIGGAATVHS